MKRSALGLVFTAAMAAPAFAEPPLTASVVQETPSRNAVQFDVSAARPGARAEIALPGGFVAPLTIERVAAGRSGTVIQAHADGETAGTTSLSVFGSTAFGTIRANGQDYVVDTGRDGLARITAGMKPAPGGDDAIALPADATISQSAPEGDTSAAAIPAGNSIVDVGLFYTSSMVDRYGLALGARMNTLVGNLNTGLANSNVPISYVLGDLEFITYSESTAPSTMLDDLASGANNANGNMTPTAIARASKGLDIISAHRVFNNAAHGNCGVGFIPGGAGAFPVDGRSGAGYNVVDNGNDIGGGNTGCSIYTFAHESGHNMGLAHNREDAASPGVYSFSYGWRVPGSFRTIMAYQSDQNEAVVPYFSDPDVIACKNPNSASEAPQACGRPINVADAADNAETLRLADTGVTSGGTPHGAAGYRSRIAGELVAAVLPASRAVQVGATATAFATIINSSGNLAQSCGLDIAGAPAGSFSYQTTNPASNQPTGSPNTPVNIPANAAQTFFFALTATSAFAASDIPVQFFCANRRSASMIAGVNTLLFGANVGALPDLIALADTLTHDGVANIAGVGQATAFVVATSNVGSSGAVIASVDTNGAAVPVAVSVCQTNPATGQCTSVVAPSITTSSIPAGGTATFAVFVSAVGAIPFDPAVNRIFLRFRGSGTTLGATSVAVRTP